MKKFYYLFSTLRAAEPHSRLRGENRLSPLNNHPIAQGALRKLLREKCKNVVNTYKFYLLCFLLLMCVVSFAQTNNNNPPMPLVEPTLNTQNLQVLFDGKNIDDWSFVGLGDFALEQGTLKSRGRMGVLWYTKKKFGHCVVRVVYKVSDQNTSSAVFVLIPKAPTDVWDLVNHSQQIKILDTNDAYHRTGSIYSFSKARAGLTKPVGQWNTLDIFLEGPRITVYVNQQLASSYDARQPAPARQASSDPERGPRPETGYIGIQNHNDLIGEVIGQIWFKEIAVLPLPNLKLSA